MSINLKFISKTELVRFWGYPIEEHFVLTEDGYILGMHRIPYGKSGKNGGIKPGPPVFLAHGLTSSSAQWVFGPPEKSLGLLLADAGNDIFYCLFVKSRIGFKSKDS